MVVLGLWPFQYSEAFELTSRTAGIDLFYLVDEHITISLDKAKKLETNGYIINMEYHIVYSEGELSNHIDCYKSQAFPMPIPSYIAEIIEKQSNKEYKKLVDNVCKSSIALLIGKEHKQVMHDIGAQYNPNLDAWIIDIINIQTLRREKKDKHKGKVYYEQYHDCKLRIWGDLISYIDDLRKLNGEYNEELDSWFVKIQHFDKIAKFATMKNVGFI